ncbi:MAG: beta-phosphoglucomutase [Bacteroidota bacterium]|nr:beta-phosphoglucomutase [Bacteroidota bacterium]
MINGFIFDLDGVIVNTEEHHYIAWKEIANKLKIDFNKSLNENLKGLSRKESLKKLLELNKKKISENEFVNFLIEKNQIYKSLIDDINETNILDGVENILKIADKNNISVAIGSSSKNAKMILKKLNLYNRFKIIIDGNMVTNPKPDPEVFIKAAKLMRKKNDECIVFEDAVSGIIAAERGGFKVIGVRNLNLKNRTDQFINSLSEFRLDDYE